MIYSANMLKTFNTCPKKYEYKYVERFSMPVRFEIFERGKKIHALACYYLRGNDTTELEKSLSQSEFELWTRLKQNPYFNMQTLAAEYELTCKIGDFWVGGRLDAVVKDNSENYYILDYKTGSIPKNPEFDLQTLVYLKALDLHLNGQYKSLNFIYIDLKNNKNELITYNPNNCEKINTILNELQADFYPQSKDKNNCKNCEYKHICY